MQGRIDAYAAESGDRRLVLGQLGWRHSSYERASKVEAGELVLSAAAIIFLIASGWLGGMLAYRYGVPVADEVTQAEGYQ